MTELTIQQRVQNGVVLLDATVPGWDQKINLRRLKLEHCSRCILGQVYGDYVKGIDSVLGLNPMHDVTMNAVAAYGFERYCRAPMDEFTKLAKEWKRVILTRRAEQRQAECVTNELVSV